MIAWAGARLVGIIPRAAVDLAGDHQEVPRGLVEDVRTVLGATTAPSASGNYVVHHSVGTAGDQLRNENRFCGCRKNRDHKAI